MKFGGLRWRSYCTLQLLVQSKDELRNGETLSMIRFRAHWGDGGCGEGSGLSDKYWSRPSRRTRLIERFGFPIVSRPSESEVGFKYSLYVLVCQIYRATRISQPRSKPTRYPRLYHAKVRRSKLMLLFVRRLAQLTIVVHHTADPRLQPLLHPHGHVLPENYHALRGDPQRMLMFCESNDCPRAFLIGQFHRMTDRELLGWRKYYCLSGELRNG